MLWTRNHETATIFLGRWDKPVEDLLRLFHAAGLWISL